MTKAHGLLAAAILAAAALPAGAAEPVMVQCGREYQAARSAGTLNGADWNRYRVACADRLKAAAAAPSAAPLTASVPPLADPPVAPAAAVAPAASTAGSTGGQSAGMVAMHARQKRCGAEWTAGKAALVAQTPGLTWPKYWSQCNTRLKAAGG